METTGTVWTFGLQTLPELPVDLGLGSHGAWDFRISGAQGWGLGFRV